MRLKRVRWAFDSLLQFSPRASALPVPPRRVLRLKEKMLTSFCCSRNAVVRSAVAEHSFFARSSTPRAHPCRPDGRRRRIRTSSVGQHVPFLPFLPSQVFRRLVRLSSEHSRARFDVCFVVRCHVPSSVGQPASLNPNVRRPAHSQTTRPTHSYLQWTEYDPERRQRRSRQAARGSATAR